MKDRVVIIAGPTAVGKTNISIKLAKKIDGEIISADSMQVYRGMNIGTAKIRNEETEGIPHHLIDILDPSEEFNVVSFAKLSKQLIRDINERGHIPIVVGGTGFYIQAMLYDIDFTDNDDDMSYRTELTKIAEKEGNEYLHDMLKKVDPESAEAIHPNNVKRVIRALEFYKKSNMCISKHNAEQKQNESPYRYKYFALTDERDVIYDRIDRRVDKMISDGLIDEVKRLLDKGIDRKCISMQGLGYKETVQYIMNEVTFDESVDMLKKGTRHFAKRQITWLKRERDVIWLDKHEKSEDELLFEMLSEIEKM